MKEYGIPLEKRYADAQVYRFEQIPQAIISDIQVNKEMREKVTDPHLQPWLDEEFLLKNAAVFAIGATPEPPSARSHPDSQNQWRSLIQPPTAQRAVLFKKDASYYDEYGNVYGEIGAKGTGTSKRDLTRLRTYRDPVGLHGHTHALQDMEVSNLFAENGGRTGRTLGVIKLDSDKLLNWFEEHGDRNEIYNLSRQVRKVEQNNDDPALLIRLMGTDRLSDKEKGAHYQKEKTYIRAARLLKREMDHRGHEEFLEHYRLNEQHQLYDDLTNICNLSQRDRGSYEILRDNHELKSLFFLSEYFMHWNRSIFMKVSRDHYNGKLSFKGGAQDIDMAGYWNDWETSVPNTPQYNEYSSDELVRDRYPTLVNNDIQHKEINTLIQEHAEEATRKAGLYDE